MVLLENTLKMKTSDGSEMGVFTARPEGKPKAGMLVFMEAFGVTGHIQEIARRLAREGYWAAAPELFHRTAPPGFQGSYQDFPAVKPHFEGLTEEGLRADIQACYEWLQTNGEWTGKKIGAIGFCLGGRVSYLANSFLPLGAAVSFYGTRILAEPLDSSRNQQGPLLLVWGGQDKGTPPEKLKTLTDSLREGGKDFVNAEFSGAGHGFNCDDRPAAYHRASADAAWALTLAFLKSHLD